MKPRSRPGSQEIKEVLEENELKEVKEVKVVKVVRREERDQEVREVMEVKEILPQRRERETSVRRDKEASEVNLTGSQGSSEGQSFSSTGPSSLNMCSLTASD